MQNTGSKNSAELEGVKKTLLLPLWARAREYRQPNPIIIDDRAKQIVESLSTIASYKDSFDEMDRVVDK